MRTIKFRGKRINRNGEWAYGDLRILPDRTLILPQDSYDAAIDRDAVDEKTIGQYTGLVDKNGKEIYEGDYVKTKGDFGGVITWNSRGYFYINQYFNDDVDEQDCTPLGSMLNVVDLYIHSNIHDNPELLKNND